MTEIQTVVVSSKYTNTIMRLIAVLVVATMLMSCKDEAELQVQTTSATWDGTTAEVSGRILNTGTNKIDEFGVCYSRSNEEDPAIESAQTLFYNKLKTQKFSITIPDLEPDTVYYVRAYAISRSQKVAYGRTLEVRTNFVR
ncbi:MAG: hypothetical protein JNJ75_13230 [Cyclobacteriaceae bacterium]|nr:hypothetical protein [Cyclobacteriaceae bacterium]